MTLYPERSVAKSKDLHQIAGDLSTTLGMLAPEAN